MRIIPVLMLCSLLCACQAQRLDELRVAELKGNDYQIALAEKFLSLAEKEAERYDWASSAIFTDLGLRAAYGQDIGLSKPSDWGVHDDETASAHTRLTETLTPEFTAQQPTQAAELHANYECWLEELDEGWDEAAISGCRNRLYAMLEGGLPATRDFTLSTSHILYFPWSSAQPDASAQNTLQSVVSQLLRLDEVDIVLNGHADRSGEEQDNMLLSAKRAEYIMAQMVQAGVPENRIRYYAFGESAPVVATADGARERANRRVEIFIE